MFQFTRTQRESSVPSSVALAKEEALAKEDRTTFSSQMHPFPIPKNVYQMSLLQNPVWGKYFHLI